MPNKKILAKPIIICILAGICCLLWGSAFPCVKIGYGLFHIAEKDTAGQMLFAGCRFTVAGILTLIFAFIFNSLSANHTVNTEKNIPPKTELFPKNISTWKQIIILSLIQTIAQYFFFYIGLANTSGVKASIIEGTNVFVAILTASLIFHQEQLTPQKILGCFIGFVGVVIINLGDGTINMSFKFIGEGFIFISTIAYAFSSVIMKKYSKHTNPVLLSGWQFFLGGLVLSIAGFLFGGRLRLENISQAGILLYLAFISAGAYTLWSILLKYNPVSSVSVYGFMNPVFGVLLSWALLHDSSQTLGIKSVIALVLVCMGIYIVNNSNIPHFAQSKKLN